MNDALRLGANRRDFASSEARTVAMDTFLVERTRPPHLRPDDPADVAMHCRWAADAYRQAGAFWLGGVVLEDRMLSLAAAEQADDLRAYARTLGIPDDDMSLRRVVRFLGPSLAGPRP
jgi:hypothetical protein